MDTTMKDAANTTKPGEKTMARKKNTMTDAEMAAARDAVPVIFGEFGSVSKGNLALHLSHVWGVADSEFESLMDKCGKALATMLAEGSIRAVKASHFVPGQGQVAARYVPVGA